MIDSDTRKECLLSDENVKIIEAQVKEICKFYKEKYKVELVKGKYVKNALVKTIRHYLAYLKEFDCKLTSVDFYKTYTWFSYSLAEELHSKDMRYRVLTVAIFQISWQLKRNKGINMNNDILKKILKLVQNELDGNKDVGMGKNGFYMVMKNLYSSTTVE